MSVDCPNDQATVSVENADTVWFKVDYVHCDELDREGELSGNGDTWSDTISLANCEGTITVWFSSDKHDKLATAAFDCETASVTVDCPSSTATISAKDTSEVFYAIDYQHCDESDVSPTSVDLTGDTDSVTVPVANCEGTITLTDDGRTLDTATFDCETASVAVDCPSNLATIEAVDTDEVWYEIAYERCDAADVGRTGPLDLSGDTDSVTVPVASCEGTITVTDDDERVLATAGFDCETASVAEVNCPEDFARIHAEDTSTVNYTVDYVHCDEADASGSLDFSETDDLTIPLANCEGTITLTDDDGRTLDTATFDCETASVAVDCPNEVATIEALDTSQVFYEIDYDDDDTCADDVNRTSVDLSGSTDSVTVPVADCAGTITLTDDDGRFLDDETFNCVPGVSLSANCDDVVADFNANATGDTFTIDVTATDSSTGDVAGSTSETETISDASGTDDMVVTYSDDTSGSYDEVDVTVNQVFDNGETRLIKEETIDLGTTCGCPECVTDEILAKLKPEVGDTDTRSVDLDKDGDDETVSFEVTRVDQDGEPHWLCFKTTGDTPEFCELCVGIQAGRGPTLDESCTIEEVDGEYCVSAANKFAISHIEIFCADQCPIDGTTFCDEGTSGSG